MAEDKKVVLDKFKPMDKILGKCDSQIDIISIQNLLPYSKHPFIVRECPRLDELIESVRQYGVLTPLLVRIHPITKGRYEILAGHHRLVAAERIGLESIPCLIRNVDDSNAALMVIDSNKQRGFADMLPSEIARALKLEYDALKCQGKRSDLVGELESILNEKNSLEKSVANADDTGVCGTSRPMGDKLKKGNDYDFSERNRQRYIRLNYLIPSLLNIVDENKIAIRSAVDISFLKEDEQQMLLQELETTRFKVDMKKAEKLKEYSARKKLASELVLQILSGDFFEKRVKKDTAIKLPYKRLSNLVDTALPSKAVEDYIIKALEFYKLNNQ